MQRAPGGLELVMKIFAFLVAVFGVIAAILTMNADSMAPGLGIMVGVILTVVIMWAAAESIAVIIDIEANTRASAIAARKEPQEPVMRSISVDAQDRLPPLRTRETRRTTPGS